MGALPALLLLDCRLHAAIYPCVRGTAATVLALALHALVGADARPQALPAFLALALDALAGADARPHVR